MRLFVVASFFVALCAATTPTVDPAVAMQFQTHVLSAFNAARGSVDPPCEYRARNGAPVSPCNSQRGNKLPPLQWAADLEAASREFATLCPHGSNVDLEQGRGQTLRISFATDARSDEQLLLDTLKWWTNPPAGAYNATSGEARGSVGRAYKQIISAQNKEVGCAVHSMCPRGRRIVCTYRTAPAPGPAYPVLTIDTEVKTKFQKEFVHWINKARAAAHPAPKQSLAALEWDAQLAASAQAWAEKQTHFPGTYDANLPANTGESRFVTNVIWAEPALGAVVHWYAIGRFYNFQDGSCGTHRGRQVPCGKFTQLMGADVRKFGCGFAFQNGNTFVYCHFDKKYNDKGVATVKPYEAK